ncbi:FmdB family zinc ribbon protein [Candidatus Spongiihabitans sp.]|uniref:FmdB family zinc ribbon protein n=1 Tax=Candidatus Spongiihabitans sp. TaxID=3101308 RepID=UPI003C705415
MPFYEYQCGDCDHRLEVLQKISDEPLIFCPQCNAASLKKLISAAAFRLKGSGWYETDFKNSDQKKEKAAKVKSASSGSSEPGASEPSDKKADTNQPNKSGADKGVPTSSAQSKESASSAAT